LRKAKNASPHDTTEFEENLAYCGDVNIEENVDLYRALDNLKEEEKELIVMRYMDDMSTRDIAQATDAPLGTVRSRLSRTIKKLRVYMEGECK
jgi:RNA polymerase sigma-70 factor (ECF subfamily)